MSDYHAEVAWERGDQDFLSGRYSRRHVLRFDGGTEVAASASPHVVPVPFADPAAVDPEEAFVASLASCHMLFFLSIAAQRKYQVERYRDAAVGTLAKNAEGQMAMTQVVLRPVVEFSGARMPTQEDLEAIHHRAHEQCYIANSVKSAVRVEVQRL
jgi:organic hydroperoxide reductase OsmC/OhrA